MLQKAELKLGQAAAALALEFGPAEVWSHLVTK